MAVDAIRALLSGFLALLWPKICAESRLSGGAVEPRSLYPYLMRPFNGAFVGCTEAGAGAGRKRPQQATHMLNLHDWPR